MSRFADAALSEFFKELGSEKGAPGGGAAAALTGALGASLLSMTARINDKRKNANKTAAVEASKASKEFLSLMEKDAEAFETISACYKSKERGEVYQRALKAGAEAPLRMGLEATRLLPWIVYEKKRTSAWLLSDLKESLLLLEACWRAAKLNIEINLKDIADKRYLKKTKGLMMRISRAFNQKALKDLR